MAVPGSPSECENQTGRYLVLVSRCRDLPGWGAQPQPHRPVPRVVWPWVQARLSTSDANGGHATDLPPATGDEHVLAAVRSKRFAVETSVKHFKLQAGHVDKSEPLVFGRPPQGTHRAVVTDEVDPVVAH